MYFALLDPSMYSTATSVYTAYMRKTTLVIDDALVEQARSILGTRGIKDTVDRALQEVVRSAARRALIRRMETLDGLDLADADVMRQAWSL